MQRSEMTSGTLMVRPSNCIVKISRSLRVPETEDPRELICKNSRTKAIKRYYHQRHIKKQIKSGFPVLHILKRHCTAKCEKR